MKSKGIINKLKWLFPGLFGLLIYFTIRLLTDTAVNLHFWERSWALNTFEIALTFSVGYLFYYILRRYEKRQKEKGQNDYSFKALVKEFLTLLFYMLIAINCTITVGVALTDDGLSWHDFVIVNIIPSLYIMLYFAIVRGNQYLKGYIENEVKLEKIENENLQTELKFLRNQFHPHFLFNALNTIYFQMDEDIDGAKSTVEKFSKLLRYQIYDFEDGRVSLKKEFEYLDNYIELMKTRKGEQLNLITSFDTSLSPYKIYPFLLQPFVENAFKYVGSSKGDPFEISIKATNDGGYLNFEVINSCFPDQPDEHEENQQGIGLEHLKRRLQLLYPKDHIYCCSKVNDQYRANLKIKLDGEN